MALFQPMSKMERYDMLIKDIMNPKLDLSDISDRFWRHSPNHHLRRDPFQRYDFTDFQIDGPEFKISLDVDGFKYEDLHVKIAYGFVIVEGKQEDKKYNGKSQIIKQFSKKYKLPKEVSPDELTCYFSDGILTLSAPNKNYYANRIVFK